jgi:hypothetical protein
MLDKSEKTHELIVALQAAVPFQVELPQSLIEHLRAQRAAFDAKPHQIVSKISYAGDEGGILCHIEPEDGQGALIVSITHLRFHRSLAFSAAVLDYQKHRTKKLKKQHGVLWNAYQTLQP